MTTQTADLPYVLPLPTASRARRLRDRFGWSAALLIEVAVILAAWEVLVGGMGLVDRRLLPPPSDIVAALRDSIRNGTLVRNFGFSAQSFAVGYVTAAVFGVGVGLVMGTTPIVRTALAPFVWTLYSIPRVAFVPLLILWFGFGLGSHVALIFLVTTFPILVNAMVGAVNVDKTLVHAARVFGASQLDVYRKVILPHSVPYILTGLRIGVVRALVGVVVAEHFGSSGGLGYMIQRAAASFDLATSFVVLFVLFAMANASMFLLDALRVRLAPWYGNVAS